MITRAELQALVNEAGALQKEIDEIEAAHRALLKPKLARLEELKVEIGSAASDRPSAATETAGGGLSWTFSAASGASVRATQPAAKLVTEIADEKTIAKLRKLAGRFFNRLFYPAFKRQGATGKWRELVFKTVPEKGTAEKIIRLCEVESVATVTIKAAEPAAEQASGK